MIDPSAFKTFLAVDEEVARFAKNVPKSFSSRAIHSGQEPEQWKSHSIVPPIHTSVPYYLDDMAAPSGGYWYSRTGNPTRECLEKCLADLDDAKFALTFASGLGAMSTILQILSTGDHILACYDIYGSTYQLFTNSAKNHGIDATFIDFRDILTIRANLRPSTKVVWMESATNPLLRVFDIKAIIEAVHQFNSNILVIVDNTFLTSYFLRPLTLGVDIVLYSLSKFMSGHSDVVMGALTTNNEDLYKRLKFLQNGAGCVPSPFDCYLVQRSLKTLEIRMKRHFRNAISVAKFLESHKNVEKVIHPALKSHPEHELATKQASGHSGMIAFYVKNANLEATMNCLKKLKMIKVAAGLGDIESTITIPSVMSSWPLPPEDRLKLGITDNLIRLSVGLEDPEDLLNDLNEALNF
ncbi:putative cystathionine gamma-lyase 2 [Culicoides brevitarsis]|uniref:putative cystathionine gamma-lyase 2 n=1 Tax=Culicoides brevitarsis TaxID=469753 RepID=UPI00307BC168